MTSVLVPLADGVEEMETVILLDVFRRAGWRAVGASIAGPTVAASRGVKLLADECWERLQPADFDVLVIPGGMGGVNRLKGHAGVLDAIRQFAAAGKLVGAICAGPLVLQAAGVLDGRTSTCHPGVRDELTRPRLSTDRVVVDGRIVTSQGPGTAMEFALKLIELADSQTAADTVAAGLILA